jgi:hypothetical protein
MKRLLAVLLAFWSIASHADVITFRFTGTIIYSTYLAMPGDSIRGTFTYDTSIQPYFKGNPNQFGYSDPRPLTGFTAQVGVHTFDARGISVILANNSGNQSLKDDVDALMISSGDPVVVDSTSYASGAIGMVLASTPGDAKAVSGFHLPRSIDVADYPNRYGFLQSDGGQDGALLQFTIDSVVVDSVVPGPR